MPRLPGSYAHTVSTGISARWLFQSRQMRAPSPAGFVVDGAGRTSSPFLAGRTSAVEELGHRRLRRRVEAAMRDAHCLRPSCEGRAGVFHKLCEENASSPISPCDFHASDPAREPRREPLSSKLGLVKGGLGYRRRGSAMHHRLSVALMGYISAQTLMWGGGCE